MDSVISPTEEMGVDVTPVPEGSVAAVVAESDIPHTEEKADESQVKPKSSPSPTYFTIIPLAICNCNQHYSTPIANQNYCQTLHTFSCFQ